MLFSCYTVNVGGVKRGIYEKIEAAISYLKALALRADAAGVAVFTSMYSANLLIMRAG